MSTPAFRENDKSQTPTALDVNWVRAQFPVVETDGKRPCRPRFSTRPPERKCRSG